MPRDVLYRYASRKLISLQARLNAIFVKRRDSGKDVKGIYAQLKFVERVMMERRIFW